MMDHRKARHSLLHPLLHLLGYLVKTPPSPVSSPAPSSPTPAPHPIITTYTPAWWDRTQASVSCTQCSTCNSSSTGPTFFQLLHLVLYLILQEVRLHLHQYHPVLVRLHLLPLVLHLEHLHQIRSQPRACCECSRYTS